MLNINSSNYYSSIKTEIDELNEKLKSLDSVISYQNEEILKTQALLLRLQICLIDQNEALNKFTEERRIMDEERNKLLKILSSGDNCGDESLGELDDDPEPEISENQESKPQDDSEPVSDDDPQSNTYDKIWHLLPVNVPSLWKHIIYAFFFKYTGKIFVGGSNGLLIGITDLGTETYKTNTNDDILQIEVMKNNKIAYLLAFTKNKIIIFDMNFFEPFQEIDLWGIRNVFNDGNTIFATLKDGSLKKMVKGTWLVVDVTNLYRYKDHCFFSSTLLNKFPLVSLEDTFLYRARKFNLLVVRQVHGVSGVRAVLKEGLKLVCYSRDTVWSLSQESVVTDSWLFTYGVKFVELYVSYMIVVDMENSIHIYVFNVDESTTKILERKIDGNVTAVGINKNLVYIARDDGVFTLKFKRPEQLSWT